MLLKLGAYGIVLVNKFVFASHFITRSLFGVSLWGGVVTSIICVRQTDIKALIAYSSIGHIALVLGGLLTCSDLGIKGAIIVVVAHGLSSPAILTFANIVYDVRYSRRLTLCKGIISLLPAACLCFFLVCATNMAAPPSINLAGEIWLITSIISASKLNAIRLALISFLVGAYSLYLYTRVRHGNSPTQRNTSHLFRASNLIVIYLQLWPLCAFILNLTLITY